VKAATFVAILIASLAASDSAAQRSPNRERGGERPRPEQEQPRAAPVPVDPFGALERELPSLRTDLSLKGEQVAAWALLERDVRDLAEMDRQRRRYLLSLRDPGDHPTSAGEMLGRLAVEAQRRADASADLRRHFEALYAMLDESQRRMIDRRMVLSQTEPLGSEGPPRR
jgi:hypothetical protein